MPNYWGRKALWGLTSRAYLSELGHVSSLMCKGGSEINVLAEHIVTWTQSGLGIGMCVCTCKLVCVQVNIGMCIDMHVYL